MSWAVALLLTPFTITWTAFVVSCMWLWFIVPLGVMPIGMAHAWGISLTVGLLTLHAVATNKGGGEEALARIIANAIGGAVVLGFGWIAQALMG